LLFEIRNTLSMSAVASLEKWSFRSTTFVPGGKLPTQSAWPVCLGFLGGPRNMDEWRGLEDTPVKLLLPLLLLIPLLIPVTMVSVHNPKLVLAEPKDLLGTLPERPRGLLVRYPEFAAPRG
jgi:hypothetical protein